LTAYPLSVLFAAGGTGGHLYPAIAIADEIKRRYPDALITFVGTRGKIEERIVPQCGYNFSRIWISGLARRLAPETLLFPLKLVVSLVQSLVLISRLRPRVIVGTGGYVCGPPLYVASMLRKPTLIQEQNNFPGITTRLLSPKVTEVHISFEGSRRYLKRQNNVHLSGTPTRAAIGSVSRRDGAAFFDLRPEKKTVLVVGGSQGAAAINSGMAHIIPSITAAGVQVLWQTGEADFERIEHGLGSPAGVRLFTFIEKMEYAYAASDLVVCRSGATTIAELMRSGLPSVLIPYPLAAADHQTHNAKAMVEKGASVMCREQDIEHHLLEIITSLLNNPVSLEQLAATARRLGSVRATETVTDAILRLAGHI